MMKRYSAIVMIVAMLLSITPIKTVEAANNVKMKSMDVEFNFDGTELQPPAGQFAFIYKGTTYVPLRFVSYALQKNVQWDGKASKVTVSEPTSSQLVSIKEKLMNSSASANANFLGKVFAMTPVKVDFIFNGKKKVLPSGQQSFMYKGTLYVPVRFMAVSSGSQITWDGKTKTVKGISNSTGTPNSSGTPTTPPSSGGAGSSTDKVSYESITSNTEAKLKSLQAENNSTLMSLAAKYLSASDDATKKKLLAQGQQQLDSLTAKFENIVGNAENQLKANGYSTEVINEYRKTFNDEIEAGKKLANELAG
ncbi:stalk domain-containing protein [Paenibacillus dakarensis]|uniref:stalk domain-containing protein n=1 Tax=Paenibacillus dakarensis TaxID=1527293 RepID=UPI0006D57B6F|nr:stalk domain-containing protein [Paenibacillus dakarensis]